MKIDSRALISTRFLERPNRFILRLRFPDGSIENCHLQDPGRLTGLLSPDVEVLVKKAENLNRKTRYSAVMVRKGKTWVSINSNMANELFAEGIEKGLFPFFKNARILKRELKIDRHRFDFLILNDKSKWITEVKSVTLVKDGVAYFPDAVTERGRRHVEFLTELKEKGKKVALVFIIQREDARAFSPEWEVDRKFSESLERAINKGLPVQAVRYKVSLDKIEYYGTVKVKVRPN